VKEMSERCDRSKRTEQTEKWNQVLRDPENSDTTLRERLNDTIKLHSLHLRQWHLRAMDMRLHDAERLGKPELQVLKLNRNGNIILQTSKTPNQ